MQLIRAVKRKPNKKISIRSYSHSYTARVTHVLPNDEREMGKKYVEENICANSRQQVEQVSGRCNTRACCRISIHVRSMWISPQFLVCMLLHFHPVPSSAVRLDVLLCSCSGCLRWCVSCMRFYSETSSTMKMCVFIKVNDTQYIFFLKSFRFLLFSSFESFRFVQQCLHTASVIEVVSIALCMTILGSTWNLSRTSESVCARIKLCSGVKLSPVTFQVAFSCCTFWMQFSTFWSSLRLSTSRCLSEPS